MSVLHSGTGFARLGFSATIPAELAGYMVLTKGLHYKTQTFQLWNIKKKSPAQDIKVVLKSKDTAGISWHVQNLGMAQLPSKVI